MSVDLAHVRQIMAEADCLYSDAEVEAAIDAVAAKINAELADRNPVVFCVMNGGLIFSGKLICSSRWKPPTCTPPVIATKPAEGSCSGKPSQKSRSWIVMC